MSIKIFGRSPLVWLAAVQSILAVVVTIPYFGLTAQTAATIMVVLSGVAALLEAIAARPLVISALTGAIRTVLVGIIAFGLPVSGETLSAIIAAITMILALVLQPNTTPAHDPAPGFLTR